MFVQRGRDYSKQQLNDFVSGERSEFVKKMFSKNADRMIDCIEEKTGFLFLCFDKTTLCFYASLNRT